MILFHGTNSYSAKLIVESGVDLDVCRRYTDFGKGFYATEDATFAYDCGKRRLSFKRGDKVSIIRFNFNIDVANSFIRRFEEPDVEWAQFITNNRNGWDYVSMMKQSDHNLLQKHPICIGPTADGNLIDTTKTFLKEKRLVEKKDVCKFLSDKWDEKDAAYPKQYTFHTDKALKFLTDFKIIY